MAGNKSIDTIISEAEQIERVWAANPTFTLGDLTLTQFQAMLASLRTRRDNLQEARAQLTAATNAAHDEGAALKAISTRARGGIRAFFGPNSTQYEQVGGTRSTDRKRPTRKPKPEGSGGSNSK
jgi:predicted nucleic acid-binding protein